ncbi:hypothetical protein [Paenibacillus woosongensis]|uniref:hypothetical protein n=1 Tax=Paenibacillus woosongensis TaxID=307580 RepID=UPI003D31631A
MLEILIVSQVFLRVYRFQTVLDIFSYQLDNGTQAFKEAGFPLQTLSNYGALIEVAIEKGIVKPDDLSLLQSWRENPESFGV